MCEYKEIQSDDEASASSSSPNCPICLETTNEFTLLRRFSCGHLAHQQCLGAMTMQCPICRKDLKGESMLCQNCFKPISNVFVRGGRVYPNCQKCFNDGIMEDYDRVKRALINTYRHAIAFDKEGFNIKTNLDNGLIEHNDAYQQLKAKQDEFTDTILNSLSSLL